MPPFVSQLPPARRRALVASAVLAAAVAAACSNTNPLAPYAIPNIDASISPPVYPLSTAPAPQGSAIYLRTPQVVRPGLVVSSTLGVVPNFDFAIDTAPGGRFALLPPKLITSASFVPRTGFQVVTTAYSALNSAPGGTYQTDSAVTVAVGQTFVVQAQTLTCGLTNPIYAKFIIDSLGTGTGALYMRALIDPNCGFKSLTPGTPKT